jgi:glycosyltransferase involved in cell wall biosynthesis
MRIDTENEYFLLQTAKRPGRELALPPNFRAFPVWRFYEQGQRFAPFLDQLLLPVDLMRLRPDLHHALSIHGVCLSPACPTVVTLHDVIPLVFAGQYTRSGFKHKMLYRLARYAGHILTPSEHARKEVHRLLGIPLARITVTHEAADERFRPAGDPSVLEETLRRYGIRRPYILYVGGFTKHDPRKNVGRLIEIFLELRRKGAGDLQLVLAGKLGDYSRRLRGEFDGLGEASGVRFTGYIEDEDLPYVYSGARCFAFPSSYEGFGLPVLEAISCGTPTVAYRNSSIPEVLGDGGLLVDEERPGHMLEAIRAVLEDDAFARELAARGLEQAKKFRWEETARKTLEVYRQVCSGKGPRMSRRRRKREEGG